MSGSVDRINAAIQGGHAEHAPDGDWFVSDWVVMARWSSVTDDRTWVSRIVGPTTNGLMTKGLMHEGLFGQWEGD